MTLAGDTWGNAGRYLAQVNSPPRRPSTGPSGRARGAGPPTARRGRTQGRRGDEAPTVVMGSRRGLTALGAALLLTLAGAVGAAIDVALSGSPGVAFGVLFIAGCILAATRVHADDLLGIVIAPPLVYALIAVGVGFTRSSGDSGGGLKSKAINIGSDLILRAPVLLLGFAVVVLIAAVRARRARVTRHIHERNLRPPGNRRRPTA
ncbi:DUF6542 domain-containing protein [Frankia sp. CiP1_Cm_nod1]|uniref:DUF6542 domain-containing protein n=2 Tax=unclassified Frankia TaxID=2632575 RepID=UPI0020252A8B